MTTIHELIQAVREHPDYVFGAVFTRADFNDPDTGEALGIGGFNASVAEDILTERGNTLIDEAKEPAPSPSRWTVGYAERPLDRGRYVVVGPDGSRRRAGLGADRMSALTNPDALWTLAVIALVVLAVVVHAARERRREEREAREKAELYEFDTEWRWPS